MKTLILLRHAKSEPQSLIKSDFNRHIIETGEARMHKVADKLMELNILPDLILCSTALRTRETLDILLKDTKWSTAVEYKDELYHASASEILNVVQPYLNSHDRIMVVGHNFGISNLALTMSENGAEQMPTSGVHILEFKTVVEPYKGKLLHTIKPKQL